MMPANSLIEAILRVREQSMDNFKFMVASRAERGEQRVCFLRPVAPEISVDDALELAALIVAIFDHNNKVPTMADEFRAGEKEGK